jgi:hypothetical protein
MCGRPAQGVSLQSGQTTKRGQQVVHVNPASFSTQAGALKPCFISRLSKGRRLGVTTPWVTFPGRSPPSHRRQLTRARLGLHLQDVNLALGNLVADVTSHEAAYR